MDFMNAREGFYLNRCVYCKEIFTGYKNEVTCPCCINKNNQAINNIFRFCNNK